MYILTFKMSLSTKTISYSQAVSPKKQHSEHQMRMNCLMNSMNIQPIFSITENVAEYSLNYDEIQKMIELEQSRECYIDEDGLHLHHFDARKDVYRMLQIEKNLRKQLDEATDPELKKAIDNILAEHLKQ